MASVKVEGLAELTRRLRALPPEIAGKNGGPLRKAIGRAAVIIRDEAKRRAPVDLGVLRDNIVAARNRRSTQGTEGYYVEVRRKSRRYGNTRRNRQMGRVGQSYAYDGTAYYGMMVELGHKARDGSPVPPQPFLRPAFESKKEEAAMVFRTELAKGIDAAVRKLGGR
jgi:HK97 gp10 family phage protein